MTDGLKATRLSKAARELNVGISNIVEFLNKKGFEIDSNPNSKIPADAYGLLLEEYSSDISVKKESEKLALSEFSRKKESVTIDEESGDVVEEIEEEATPEAVVEEKTEPIEKEVEKVEEKKESKKAEKKETVIEKTDGEVKDYYPICRQDQSPAGISSNRSTETIHQAQAYWY